MCIKNVDRLYMQLILLTIVIIFYIVISNYLSFDVNFENYILSKRYSLYVIIFIIAMLTIYIQNSNLPYFWYPLLSGIVLLFFYLTPFIRLSV